MHAKFVKLQNPLAVALAKRSAEFQPAADRPAGFVFLNLESGLVNHPADPMSIQKRIEAANGILSKNQYRTEGEK